MKAAELTVEYNALRDRVAYIEEWLRYLKNENRILRQKVEDMEIDIKQLTADQEYKGGK